MQSILRTHQFFYITYDSDHYPAPLAESHFITTHYDCIDILSVVLLQEQKRPQKVYWSYLPWTIASRQSPYLGTDIGRSPKICTESSVPDAGCIRAREVATKGGCDVNKGVCSNDARSSKNWHGEGAL